MSQLEAIVENKPLQRQVTPGFNNGELNESMIEGPVENKAIFGDGQREGEIENETIQSQIEPIKGNDPHFRDASALESALVNRSANDSMIEAIKDNKPLYRNPTTNGPLIPNKSIQFSESIIEPVSKNNPRYSKVSPMPPNIGNNGISENESFIEPPNASENQPFFQDAPPAIGELADADQQMIEPIRGNTAFFKEGAKEGELEDEKNDAIIEPINDNRALFKNESGKTGLSVSDQQEMVEAIKGNSAVFKEGMKEGEDERQDSMMEPIQENKPEIGKVEYPPTEDERKEQMVEPIKQNLPERGNIEYPPTEEERQETLIEPIKSNPASKGKVEYPVTEDEREEKLIESIKGNSALFNKSDMKKEGEEPLEERTDTEKMIEPIKGNSALFNKDDSKLSGGAAPSQEEERHDSLVEAIPNSTAVYEKVDPAANKPPSRQINESQMMEPKNGDNKAFYKTVNSEAFQQSKQDSTEDLMQVEPVFEQIPPQEQSKEDIEIHPTEPPFHSQPSSTLDDVGPHYEEEVKEQPVPIHTVSQQPLAKKIKKILYSDKSESSIDEMMEDTPSNYNIPNGRLDGRSLGLKAILLHEKKRGRQNDDAGVGGPIPNLYDKIGKTLQPVASDKLSSKKAESTNKGGDGHQYFSPARGSIQRNEPSLLQKSANRVNNLFQDNSEVQLQTMNKVDSARIPKNAAPTLSQIRQNQKQQKSSQQDSTIQGKANTTSMNDRQKAEALDLGGSHEYNPTFGPAGADQDGEDNEFFEMDQGSKAGLQKGQIQKGASRQVPPMKSMRKFKEEGGNSGAEGSPPTSQRYQQESMVNPYTIKTPVPEVNTKPPKLSLKR